jgi:hypothetical protein
MTAFPVGWKVFAESNEYLFDLLFGGVAGASEP